MTLRADHVAGGAFIGFGLLVLALSGDLPMGSLSMPGSGFLPKILAGLTIMFGLTLIAGAAQSRTFAEVEWSDGTHAGLVIAITAAAVALYERLGFLTTMVLMMLALLLIVERRRALSAALYSVSVVAITYVTFEYLLKTPLATGPLGF